MKKTLYEQQYTEENTPGLDAITNRERDLYGTQEPTHWATVLPYQLGGEDPLWGVNCFISDHQQRHFHYIGLGCTDLFYNPDYADNQKSGYGFEMTFRHLPLPEDPDKPVWPVNMLQNLARHIFKTGTVFDDYMLLYAGESLRQESDSEITAILFYEDPEMGALKTPHGYMQFLQLFGVTTTEYNLVKENKITTRHLLEAHITVNPLLITDMTRSGSLI